MNSFKITYWTNDEETDYFVFYIIAKNINKCLDIYKNFFKTHVNFKPYELSYEDASQSSQKREKINSEKEELVKVIFISDEEEYIYLSDNQTVVIDEEDSDDYLLNFSYTLKDES